MAVIFLAGPRPTEAQILNTLVGFNRKAEGVSGGADLSISASGGNTDVLSLGAGVRLQFRTGRERFRILLSGTRSTSRGRATEESLTAHLRHNHRLIGPLYTVAFTQIQRDPFRRLNTRVLFGGGLRVDLISTGDEYLAVGLTPMLEIEDLDDVPDRDTDTRLSLFVTGEVSPGSSIRLGGTAFVQPRASDLEDVRSIANATVSVDLGNGLSLRQTGSYEYDSDPPAGVERSDWSIRTGFGVGF